MDVFISYSRKDRERKSLEGSDVIAQLQAAFNDSGISYWLDEEGIHSGETFASVISRNIAECSIFLFISSINSNASRWTCGEIATASTYDKRIIPFKIDDAPYDPSITIYLAALDTINYYSNPEKAIRRLIKSIKQYLAELEEEKLSRERERQIAEVEEEIRGLDNQIDDLLEEKNILLRELIGVKSQIAGLRNVDGDLHTVSPQPVKRKGNRR